MKIGIYGRNVDKEQGFTYREIFSALSRSKVQVTVEKTFHQLLDKEIELPENISEVFHDRQSLISQQVNVLISLGGDGTLLDTVNFVRNTNIPVMGINLGRLGFLSNIAKQDMCDAIQALSYGQYRQEKRSMLELKTDDTLFSPNPYALNDFTIHKRDTGSMIAIDTYLNGEYFTTYWADGIIIATPTGSTAYSLSCGGPILFPDSGTFVITPVAPHNLNSRPIIVSDSTIISFRVKGRGQSHLISLDSRYEIIEQIKEIAVQKAPFFFNLVKLNNQNFINTLREKLKWGLDTRNN